MKRKSLIILFFVLTIAGIIAAVISYRYYRSIFEPNVSIQDGEDIHWYIPSDAKFEYVTRSLFGLNILKDTANFLWLSDKKNLATNVKSGHYIIRDGMSNNEIINMIVAGRQTPVKAVFHNVRTIPELAGIIAGQLELDSSGLTALLTNQNYIAELGYNLETIPALFIPNTYEFYWNTSAKSFIARMQKEHAKFWNDERTKQAERIGLTPTEVSTLASIIDEETAKNDEKAKIAGVYINRLKNGIPLQADPTIKFALGDPGIKRVLNSYLTIESPYNTYKYRGLPPGPIRIPSIAALKAVINHESHDYYYFCAKADFSGYHAFAKTLSQHLRNAKEYQQALNKKRIYR